VFAHLHRPSGDWSTQKLSKLHGASETRRYLGYGAPCIEKTLAILPLVGIPPRFSGKATCPQWLGFDSVLFRIESGGLDYA
jgi:hypothetical protein